MPGKQPSSSGGDSRLSGEGEAQPLLGLASPTTTAPALLFKTAPSVVSASGSGGLGVGVAVSDGNNSGSSNVASPAFFPDNSLIRIIFLRSAVGQKVRGRLCLGWGLMSLGFAFAVLKVYYKNTSARSFFIATTTLTTIGYAMSEKDANTADYPFLSVFFLFFVLPFSFLQSVVFLDSVSASAALLGTRIAARCRRGNNASASFVAEFWSSMAVTSGLLAGLLFLGTICYSYFGKLTSWRKGVFYAITSATTIGYGSFEVQNEYGYWAVGLFAITCNYAISIIFPNIAAFFVVAGDNVDKVSRIRQEEIHLSQRVFKSRDLDIT